MIHGDRRKFRKLSSPSLTLDRHALRQCANILSMAQPDRSLHPRRESYASSSATLTNDEDSRDWRPEPSSSGTTSSHEGYRSVIQFQDPDMADFLLSQNAASHHRLANDPTPTGLTAIWAPTNPTIDIIFVHGLGGSAGKTWSYKSDFETFWPSWLHKEPELSTARVHTFGYDASIVGRKTTSGIFDFANDLLYKMKMEYVNHDRSRPIGSVSASQDHLFSSTC